MSFNQCPFCGQANVADAKFCSECGGALHLSPCPSCGAVNQVTSSACYQCRRPLQRRETAAPAPSSPAATFPESFAAAVLPASSGAVVLPESLPVAVVPESLPVAVVPESLPRRHSRAIVGTVVAVAIAALGYNAYRQRSAQDEPRPQAASSEATARSAPGGAAGRDGATGVSSAGPAGTGAGTAGAATLSSGTSLAAPTPAAMDQSRASQPVESQKAKAAVPAAALPQAVSASKAGTPGGPFVHEACTEAGAALGLCVMSPARKKAETAAAVGTAIWGAPATGSPKSGGQEPARPQECTEAVAALGLCPPGITQGRK